MKALKTLVFGLAGLIVLAFGLLVYGVSRTPLRSAGPLGVPAHLSDVNAPAPPAAYTVDLPVPAGSRLQQMDVVGDRLVLRLSSSERDQLVVVDPQTGRVTGRLTLQPDSR